MKEEIKELNKWDGDGVLRYRYVSPDMEYLEDKADRIFKVINAINKIEEKYDIHLGYHSSDDDVDVTLDIMIQMNEEYKCKKDKDKQEGNI